MAIESHKKWKREGEAGQIIREWHIVEWTKLIYIYKKNQLTYGWIYPEKMKKIVIKNIKLFEDFRGIISINETRNKSQNQ